MKRIKRTPVSLLGVFGTTLLLLHAAPVSAKAPCGDHGECKALIEINATDGDIGFHFLMDGENLTFGKLKRPDGRAIFKAEAVRDLREQYFTEMFVESAEPLCFDPLTDEDPENDDEDFVTLEDFLARWTKGEYTFVGDSDGERLTGRTSLTFNLPAAPTNLAFDSSTGNISWDPGSDLGECATEAELTAMVGNGDLPTHPKAVKVRQWEIVFEPDVEDDDPSNGLKYSIRVPGDIAVRKIRVPGQYRKALPDDTPAKIEVGAINAQDNATFTELVDICLNEVNGCDGDE